MDACKFEIAPLTAYVPCRQEIIHRHHYFEFCHITIYSSYHLQIFKNAFGIVFGFLKLSEGIFSQSLVNLNKSMADECSSINVHVLISHFNSHWVYCLFFEDFHEQMASLSFTEKLQKFLVPDPSSHVFVGIYSFTKEPFRVIICK